MQIRKSQKVVISYYCTAECATNTKPRIRSLNSKCLQLLTAFNISDHICLGNILLYLPIIRLFVIAKKKLNNPSNRVTRWTLNTQEYNFEVKWRPGTENSAADALSRLETEDVKVMTVLNLNTFGAEEHSITLDEIKIAQSEDQLALQIIKYLEQGSLPQDQKDISQIVR